jgi:pilus assembly protein CpaB
LIVLAIVIIIVGIIVAIALPSLQGSGNAAPTQPVAANGTGTDGTEDTRPVASGPTPTPIQMGTLVVAVQDLPRGFTIPADGVREELWPIDSIPVQAITSMEEVIGQKARVDLFRFQPILSNLIVPDLSGLGATGSDLSAILPPNRVAIAVPVDRVTSVAFGMQPGDFVDVLVSFLFVNVDTAFQSIEPNRLAILTQLEDGTIQIAQDLPGRIDTIPAGIFGTLNVIVVPDEPQRPRLATQRTIQNAQVMWIGDFPSDGRLFKNAPTPTPVTEAEDSSAAAGRGGTPTATPRKDASYDIVTLAVESQEAVIMTWLVEARLPITFALRSASTSQASVPTDPVTLDYILNAYRINVPERTQYSIEPAIRSIRQLYAGSQIELNYGVNTTP